MQSSFYQTEYHHQHRNYNSKKLKMIYIIRKTWNESDNKWFDIFWESFAWIKCMTIFFCDSVRQEMWFLGKNLIIMKDRGGSRDVDG